ncbi:Hsp20/alpha crystallin family protein [Roseomonas chloroacetimidivorans]|uniref:Hsp20/alpha crystallin family protein n=1 Tax=Roseomonas chloroacetimidivorans TaxID=1766656 RepID=UPI003C76FACE
MDRIFDNFWRGVGSGLPSGRGAPSFGLGAPAIDMVEGEKEYRLTAELPGIDTADLDLSLSGDVLTISGEKNHERDEEAQNYFSSERSFGSFRRSLQLPQSVDREKISADFSKGVLTVTLPKTPEAAQQPRKIEVKAAAK